MTLLSRARAHAPGITIANPPAGLKHAEIAAVLTRADGTVVDLGVLAATDFRPTILQRLRSFLCRRP